MRSFHPAPACPGGARSTSTRRLGVNASCLLLSIISANHSAARTDISLPYLLNNAPEALRFSPPFVLGPPPPRPEMLATATPAAGANAALPSPVSVPPNPDESTSPPESSATTVTTTASPPAPVVLMPSPALAPTGVIIVPDAYAPARPIVTVEQLLPFFVPPPAPASRATYELK